MNCLNHPDRHVVNRFVCDQQWCAECIEQHKQNYADRMIERDKEARYCPPSRQQNQLSPDGRSIYWEQMGYYTRKEGE